MVTVTCSVENLPRLKWSTSIFELTTNAYVYSDGDESQTPIDIDSPFPGVRIEIVSVTQSSVDPDWFIAVSTLNTTLSVLEKHNVHNMYCGSNEVQSGVLIFIVDVRLTSANLTLLVLGVILFCVAIAGCVIIVLVEVKSDKGINYIRTYCASMNYNTHARP